MGRLLKIEIEITEEEHARLQQKADSEGVGSVSELLKNYALKQARDMAAEEAEMAAAAMRGAAVGGTAPATPAGDEAGRGISPLFWIGGLIIVVVILLAIFSS